MIKHLAQDLLVFVVVSLFTGALVIKNKAVQCGKTQTEEAR